MDFTHYMYCRQESFNKIVQLIPKLPGLDEVPDVPVLDLGEGELAVVLVGAAVVGRPALVPHEAPVAVQVRPDAEAVGIR